MACLIFDKFTYGELSVLSIVIFAVGGSAMFIPYYRLFGKCVGSLSCYSSHKNKVEKNFNAPYSNFRTGFFTEYDRANPITSEEAMNEYMTFLLSRSI